MVFSKISGDPYNIRYIKMDTEHFFKYFFTHSATVV